MKVIAPFIKRRALPGGGQGVGSIMIGRIGLCSTSANVTSRAHVREAAYLSEVQQKLSGNEWAAFVFTVVTSNKSQLSHD